MRRPIPLISVALVAATVACSNSDSVAPDAPTAVGPLLATASDGNGLSITTDKDDYAPGDTVWFTGAGWQAADTLDIVLTDEPITHAPHVWAVPVGRDGTFRDSTYVVDAGDLGVTFTLTATSRANPASTLTVQFTDANSSINFFDMFPRTTAAGGTFTWLASAICTGPGSGANSCSNHGSSVNGPVPNGYTIELLRADGACGTPGQSFVQVASATTIGGSAGGTVQAPALSGAYAYRTRHPQQDINNNNWASVGAGTTLCVSVDVEAPATNQTPTAVVGGPYTTDEGSLQQLDGTASSDPEDGTDITYIWSIEVSGNVAPYQAIDAGGACQFHAASDGSDAGTATSTLDKPYIMCTDDGVFKVSLMVTDKGTPSLSSTAATTQFTVRNVAPTADAGGGATGYSVTEGAAVSLTGSFTDPGSNDTHTYQWGYALASGVDAGATCTFSPNATTSLTPTISCTDDGTFTVTLVVTDDEPQASLSDAAALTVSNVAPVVTSLTLPMTPVPVSTPVNLSGAFTDVGTNDTHTASIDWGDGASADPGSVLESSGSGSVSKSHSYTAAGIYTVVLTVTDDDTGADTETFEYVVVYDPSAGFVTGGGWIDSPLGAYIADPSLGGKATLGFVSKYLRGANVPTGNTQFQFHAAGMNFSSSSYEWLVVQGTNRATYKGEGTINGSGQFGFLLAAYDGGTSGDKFRIKIWDKATGDIVYDNNMGAGDDDAPTTSIGGGSIQIHVPKK